MALFVVLYALAILLKYLSFFIIFGILIRNTLVMEKVTLTKLYEVLAQKVGRNEAECLTQYVEIKVKDELNNKTEILATKKDFFVLKEEIHSLRNEMKEHSLALQKWIVRLYILLIILLMGLYPLYWFKL